jgi:hypothetical protein
MNYRCPHCDTNLRFRFLKHPSSPGTKSWLRSLDQSLCPKCSGVVQKNIPLAERVLDSFSIYPFILCSLAAIKTLSFMLSVGLIALACWLIAGLFVHIFLLQKWPRFKKAIPPSA